MTERKEIDPAILEDIALFRGLLAQVRKGELTDDDFAPKRLGLGIYGQRQEGVQMYRAKIPYGGLDSGMLRTLARIARDYGGGKLHVTTRQNIQIHFIPLEKVEEVMRVAGEADIMSREACGNTVRTIVGCPRGGVCAHERFDPTPYAHALTHRLIRQPEFQSLPRKFKISFTACPQPCPDCGVDEPVGWLHDLGFEGDVIDGRVGFHLWIGGGLGNAPKLAFRWPEFLAPEKMIPTAIAAISLFNAQGNRTNRARARMKFLVKKLGWEEFQKEVRRIRATLPDEGPNLERSETAPRSGLHSTAGVDLRAFAAWSDRNATAQRQEGFSTVVVNLPIGDATPDQAEALADIADRYADGRLRSTLSQNLLLRWVRSENLQALFRELSVAGLGESSYGTALDLTSCPGASTCKLAFTQSKHLGTELRSVIRENADLFDGEKLTIKMSGCPNSCGQHHISDIGFYGVARKMGDRELPAYMVLLGGGLAHKDPGFGTPIGKVPARLAGLALKRIVRHYRGERADEESFHDFAGRVGAKPFRTLLEDLVKWAPTGSGQDAKMFRDVGEEVQYVSNVGQGECAR